MIQNCALNFQAELRSESQYMHKKYKISEEKWHWFISHNNCLNTFHLLHNKVEKKIKLFIITGLF